MTQGQFITFLHENGCALNQDFEGAFYQVKRTVGGTTYNYNSTMPISQDGRVMRKATICLICHMMGIIEKPADVQEYYNEFFEPVIIENHFKRARPNDPQIN